jgi:hypothetical protein
MRRECGEEEREEKTRGWRNFITMSFIMYTPHRIL